MKSTAIVKQDILRNNGRLWWEEGKIVQVTDSFPSQIVIYTGTTDYMALDKDGDLFDELFEVIEFGGSN